MNIHKLIDWLFDVWFYLICIEQLEYVSTHNYNYKHNLMLFVHPLKYIFVITWKGAINVMHVW
jgi:hypothetical protein